MVEEQTARERVQAFLDFRESRLAFPFDVIVDIDGGSLGHFQLLASDVAELAAVPVVGREEVAEDEYRLVNPQGYVVIGETTRPTLEAVSANHRPGDRIETRKAFKTPWVRLKDGS